jgi:hypothetical protein
MLPQRRARPCSGAPPSARGPPTHEEPAPSRAPAAARATPRPAPRAQSFANRGYAVDGGTAFVNVALLLLLVAIASERILGLDKARAGFDL